MLSRDKPQPYLRLLVQQQLHGGVLLHHMHGAATSPDGQPPSKRESLTWLRCELQRVLVFNGGDRGSSCVSSDGASGDGNQEQAEGAGASPAAAVQGPQPSGTPAVTTSDNQLLLALRIARLLRTTPAGRDDPHLAVLGAVLAASPGGGAASAAAGVAPLLGDDEDEDEGSYVVGQVASSRLVEVLLGWRQGLAGELLPHIESKFGVSTVVE